MTSPSDEIRRLEAAVADMERVNAGKPTPEKIHNCAVIANWSESTAKRFTLAVGDFAIAKAAATSGLSDASAAAILQATWRKGDVAVARAFRDAADFRRVLACLNVPDDDPERYIGARADGTRYVLTAREACERFQNARADSQEHIDTSRPSDPGSRQLPRDAAEAQAVYTARAITAKRSGAGVRK